MAVFLSLSPSLSISPFLTNSLNDLRQEEPIRDLLEIRESCRVACLSEVVIGPVHVDLHMSARVCMCVSITMEIKQASIKHPLYDVSGTNIDL